MRYILFIALYFIAFSVYPTSYTWVGTTSDWSTSTNWSPAGIPGTSDVVTINGSGTESPVLFSNLSLTGLNLSVKTFNLNGNTLTLTGNSTFSSGAITNGILTIDNSTGNVTFSGGVTIDVVLSCKALNLYLNGGVFNQAAEFEMYNTVNIYSIGGNTFNSITKFSHYGSNHFYFAHYYPDTYQSDIYLSNHSNGFILMFATSTKNNIIRGNIYVSQTTGSNIHFHSGTGSTDFYGALYLNPDQSYFQGSLILRNLIQKAAIDINFEIPKYLSDNSPSNGILQLQYCDFLGKVNFKAPHIFLTHNNFQNDTYFEKTSSRGSYCHGGNQFFGITELKNSGSEAFIMGGEEPDIYHHDLVLANTGSSSLAVAHSSTGTIFKGNVYVNSTEGDGVRIGSTNNSGSILEAGKSILFGTLGFTKGQLQFYGFNQVGSDPLNFEFPPNSLPTVRFGGNSVFRGPVTVKASGILFYSCKFYGTGYFEKNGSFTVNGHGGAEFFENVEFVHSGESNFILGNSIGDYFHKNVTLFNKSPNGNIYLGYNSPDNFIDGDLILKSDYQRLISIGHGNNAQVELHEDKTIIVNSSEFIAGSISFRGFTYNGTIPLYITLNTENTNSYIQFRGGSSWNCPINCTASKVLFQGGDFYGTVDATKTGSSNDSQNGINNFYDDFTYNSSGSQVLFGQSASDIFNFYGNATFNRNTLGSLYLGWKESSLNFYKDFNIQLNIPYGANPIGAYGGKVSFLGSENQQININRNAISINNLTINKPGGKVVLNTSFNFKILNSFLPELNLLNGVIEVTNDNFISLVEEAIINGGSPSSYIDGKVKRIITDNFEFPIGEAGYYRPLRIENPSVAASDFSVEYKSGNHPQSTSLTGELESISNCEYWVISGPSVTADVAMFWNESSCTSINDLSAVKFAYNMGTNWEASSSAQIFGSPAAGSVKSNFTFNTSDRFITLGEVSQLIINTSNLQETSFKVTGIGLDNEIFTSGANGTDNGRIIFSPTTPDPDVEISFLPTTSKEELKLNLDIQNKRITSVNVVSGTSEFAMNPENFRIQNNKEVIFYSETELPERIAISTNLTNGVLFERGNIFSVSIPSGFLSSSLRIINPATDEVIIPSDLNWDGKINGTDADAGVYKFEVDLTDKNGLKTYKGQLILK